ncbi:MAG TPA: helix-turn-helix domain-containing protein [Candidatus Lokiarchaeia archaeon]
MSKDIDYEQKILDLLSESLFGLTITAISDGVSISRNTAYRYLGILEAKGKVYNKKVGTYNLYFAKKRSMLYKDGIINFVKGLMNSLKKKFPNKEQLFKEIGKEIAESIDIPFTQKGREQLEELKNFPDDKILESIEMWVPFFNILFDSISLSNVEINKEKKQAIYTFIHSELLETSDQYIYYFYLLAGLVGKKLSDYSNRTVDFEVLNYEIFDKKENSYLKYIAKII